MQQTDRQTNLQACYSNTALCTKVHRAEKGSVCEIIRVFVHYCTSLKAYYYAGTRANSCENSNSEHSVKSIDWFKHKQRTMMLDRTGR